MQLKTSQELHDLLREAKEKVQIGQVYEHIKGSLYKVKQVALLEDVVQPAVVYASIETGVMWIRPVHEFLQRFKIKNP